MSILTAMIMSIVTIMSTGMTTRMVTTILTIIRTATTHMSIAIRMTTMAINIMVKALLTPMHRD
jgi:hypothetical protein